MVIGRLFLVFRMQIVGSVISTLIPRIDRSSPWRHRRKPLPTYICHLDEVVISIAGKKHWMWRAVDQDGDVLDKIVQTRRDPKAASAC